MDEYPYRANTPAEQPAVNAKISQALVDFDPVLYGLARRYFPKACRDDIDDYAQLCRIHLARYSLPRFNASRPNADGQPPAVSAFLYSCVRYFMLTLTQKVKRSKRRQQDISELADTLPGRDLSRTTEALAEAVVEFFRTRPCHRREAACLESLDLPLTEAARVIGVKVGSVPTIRWETRHMVRSRARDVLEDAAYPTPYHSV